MKNHWESDDQLLDYLISLLKQEINAWLREGIGLAVKTSSILWINGFFSRMHHSRGPEIY